MRYGNWERDDVDIRGGISRRSCSLRCKLAVANAEIRLDHTRRASKANRLGNARIVEQARLSRVPVQLKFWL